MYPKQIYQAQSLYNKNKDNFREMKIQLFNELPQFQELDNVDALFNLLIVKDIKYIALKFDINLNYNSNAPELFYILSLVSYILHADHFIAGLQRNDLETKMRITDYIEKTSSVEIPTGFIFHKLRSKNSNQYLFKVYSEFLLQIAQSIVASDQNVTAKEMIVLNDFNNEINSFNFGTEIKETLVVELNSNNSKSKNVNDKASNEKLTIEEVLAELDSFVGMEGIKKEVRSLINIIKIQKQRESQGLTTVKPSFHMVFTGPPGTGKTSVARIMGKVFNVLGILKKGHLVETDRSGLVAGYVGQTAIKVDEIVNSAKDGVLFIDEAYTLSPPNSQDSFGQEAIDTLLKRMEDYRENLVVIVAGYYEEMQRFIESNPGIKSRFNRYFHFEDFKPEEMIKIFDSIVRKNNYTADESLVKKLNEYFIQQYNNRTKSFGNGRLVRNVFEKIVENQANRLSFFKNELSKEELVKLTEDDFKDIS